MIKDRSIYVACPQIEYVRERNCKEILHKNKFKSLVFNSIIRSFEFNDDFSKLETDFFLIRFYPLGNNYTKSINEVKEFFDTLNLEYYILYADRKNNIFINTDTEKKIFSYSYGIINKSDKYKLFSTYFNLIKYLHKKYKIKLKKYHIFKFKKCD